MLGILLIAESCKACRVFCWTRHPYKHSIFPAWRLQLSKTKQNTKTVLVQLAFPINAHQKANQKPIGSALANWVQCTLPPHPIYQTHVFDFSRVWFRDYSRCHLIPGIRSFSVHTWWHNVHYTNQSNTFYWSLVCSCYLLSLVLQRQFSGSGVWNEIGPLISSKSTQSLLNHSCSCDLLWNSRSNIWSFPSLKPGLSILDFVSQLWMFPKLWGKIWKAWVQG